MLDHIKNTAKENRISEYGGMIRPRQSKKSKLQLLEESQSEKSFSPQNSLSPPSSKLSMNTN